MSVVAESAQGSPGTGHGGGEAEGPAGRRQRTISLGGSRYPLMLPSLRDPRLHTASVVISVQVLGQVALGFELSIAQILASIATCALIELVVVFRNRRVVAWPASAMLTGNGIALILRVNGTEHGDWWSTNGIWVFILAGACAMASKYHIRVAGRALFNPSNLALVLVFLVLGSGRVAPQDFWWGPWSIGLALTYAVVLVGGVLITRRLGLLVVAASFWVPFAFGIGLLAASGQAISARWSLSPVDGMDLWRVVVFSPEILIFAFFMITDPRTVPEGRRGRVLFGLCVAASSVLLAVPQTTEFAYKVAVLAGLAVACLLRPAIEAIARSAAWDDHRSSVRPAGTLAVAGLSVAALILTSAQMWTPTVGVVGTADGPATAVRPDTWRDRTDDPVVQLSDDLRSLDIELDQEGAQRVLTDVLDSLEIERHAVEEGDAQLLATASTASRLREMQDLVRAGYVDHPEAPMTPTQATLVVVRGGSQSVPTIGVHLHGTTDDAASTEADRTYGVMRVGGHYLISSVRYG